MSSSDLFLGTHTLTTLTYCFDSNTVLFNGAYMFRQRLKPWVAYFIYIVDAIVLIKYGLLLPRTCVTTAFKSSQTVPLIKMINSMP
jgi:hypothetical protein